jgi:hypothetical protein
MRRPVAHDDHVHRHRGPRSEGPTLVFSCKVTSAGRGERFACENHTLSCASCDFFTAVIFSSDG